MGYSGFTGGFTETNAGESMKKLLTDALIAGTSVKTGRLNIFDSKFSGLFIQIFPQRKVFRYKTRDPHTKKQIYHNLGTYPTTSIESARLKASELSVRRGKEKEETTLRLALYDHLKILEAKQRKPRTIQDVKYYIEHYCNNWLDTSLQDFTRKTAEQISLHITSEKGQHNTSRLTTRNLVIKYLRSVFNTAIKNGINIDNPFSKPETRGLLTPTLPRRVESLYTSLPAIVSFANALLHLNTMYYINNKIRVSDNCALTLFLLLTGIRIGDATKITYGDISPYGTFMLRDTKNRNTYELPLPPLFEQLAYWKPKKSDNAEELRKIRVFPTYDIRTVLEKAHEMMLESSLFKDLWAGRGTSRLRPHDLRKLYTAVATSTLLNTDIIDMLTCRAPTGVRAKYYVNSTLDMDELKRAALLVTDKILDIKNMHTSGITVFPKIIHLSTKNYFDFMF